MSVDTVGGPTQYWRASCSLSLTTIHVKNERPPPLFPSLATVRPRPDNSNGHAAISGECLLIGFGRMLKRRWKRRAEWWMKKRWVGGWMTRGWDPRSSC
ncbi:hypothetical protein DPEC_G00228080 [Dallia pectoralis]|uniref:Uncharacterized protein n=1 Tax=Dallia pectoralis TaxID=75939 RepID=A0ACC2G1C6_DALPE|nr:hypothetical protein DPEC_G00228080 [Dallia pectoralis]